jgi:hypothetical protein
MTHADDDLITQLQASGRLNPDATQPPVPLSSVSPQLRPYARIVDELSDARRQAGAPRLEDDPAARLLGLVPTPDLRLNGKLLRLQRQRQHRTVGFVADRLREQGWKFTAADIMRWENTSAADVPPIIVESLAALLGTAPAALTSERTSSEPDIAAQLRTSNRFSDLVDRWARLRRLSAHDARSALESRVLSTVHRGTRTDVDDTLASLEAFITALEKRDGDES